MDYFNDPELNGKYLGMITKDFATASNPHKAVLKHFQTKSRVGALLLPFAAGLV